MKILIIKRIKTDIHGTVTLAGRLLQYFNESGHDCWLSKHNDSVLVDNFGFQKKILPVNDIFIGKHAGLYRNLGFDAIYCLTTDDAVTGLRLRNRFFKSATVFIGIYHPRQFMSPSYFLPNFREYLNKKIIKNICPAQLIFMDEPCRKTHSRYYHLDLENATMIPLPMNITGRELNKDYKKNKLVSVGRLTDFKPYPFGVIRAMHALKISGRARFSYHIIGDGPRLNELKKLVTELGMQDDVVLYGNRPYEEVNGLISDSYCFIGMGTAVGEASGIGLPSLIAIVDDETFTYGLLSRAPENVVGEPGEDIPKTDYKTALLDLQELNEEAYREERQRSAVKAKFYSTENIGGLFLKAFEHKDQNIIKISFLQNLFYILSKIQTKIFIKKEFRHK